MSGFTMGKRMYLVLGWRSFVGFSEVQSPKDADGDSDMSEDPIFL